MNVDSQWKPTVKTWYVNLYQPITAAIPVTRQTVTVPSDINSHVYEWKWCRVKNYFVYIANNFFNNSTSWNLAYLSTTLPIPGTPVCDYATSLGATLSLNYVQDLLINSNTTYTPNRTKAWKPLTQSSIATSVEFVIQALPGPVTNPNNVVLMLELEFSDSPTAPVYD